MKIDPRSKECSQVRPIDPDKGFKAIPSIKILPEYFEAVIKGRKRAELRLNDRDYKEGDIYDLKEWDAEKQQYTGRKQNILITHVLQGFQGQQEGWCMFSFKTIEEVFNEAYEDDTLPSARTLAIRCEKYQKEYAELIDLYTQERKANKGLSYIIKRILNDGDEKISKAVDDMRKIVSLPCYVEEKCPTHGSCNFCNVDRLVAAGYGHIPTAIEGFCERMNKNLDTYLPMLNEKQRNMLTALIDFCKKEGANL